jgi:hypothetical protein
MKRLALLALLVLSAAPAFAGPLMPGSQLKRRIPTPTPRPFDTPANTFVPTATAIPTPTPFNYATTLGIVSAYTTLGNNFTAGATRDVTGMTFTVPGNNQVWALQLHLVVAVTDTTGATYTLNTGGVGPASDQGVFWCSGGGPTGNLRMQPLTPDAATGTCHAVGSAPGDGVVDLWYIIDEYPAGTVLKLQTLKAGTPNVDALTVHAGAWLLAERLQ